MVSLRITESNSTHNGALCARCACTSAWRLSIERRLGLLETEYSNRSTKQRDTLLPVYKAKPKMKESRARPLLIRWDSSEDLDKDDHGWWGVPGARFLVAYM